MILMILILTSLFIYFYYLFKNISLIKKYNLKELADIKKQEIKQNKFYKTFNILFYVLLPFFIISIPITIVALIYWLFVEFIVALLSSTSSSLETPIVIPSLIILIATYAIFITNKLYLNINLNKFLEKKIKRN